MNQEILSGRKEVFEDDVWDSMCDPNNPRVVEMKDVRNAAKAIKDEIVYSPCTKSKISSLINYEVFFKKDFYQYTGSFKERGARNTLLNLSADQKEAGVISASAGNHALAMAYHGQDLGISVTVVMPRLAPAIKVNNCKQYNANIILEGRNMGEAKDFALRFAKEHNLLYINGYDHPHIIAGQGTMGLEIMKQVSNIDAVIVPIGGGGLIAGVALAIKSIDPTIQVMGVEPEACAAFTAAMEAGRPVYVEAAPSLADGLIVPVVGVNAFATASMYVDKVVTVSEEAIATAILRMLELEKAVVEGAGAAALAALLSGKLPELAGKRVVILLSGGNIDSAILGRCIERGLAADGKLIKFTATVSDRNGGVGELINLLAGLGVNVKDISIQSAWTKTHVFQFEVKCVCEINDYDHYEKLKSALEPQYDKIRFKLQTTGR